MCFLSRQNIYWDNSSTRLAPARRESGEKKNPNKRSQGGRKSPWRWVSPARHTATKPSPQTPACAHTTGHIGVRYKASRQFISDCFVWQMNVLVNRSCCKAKQL